MAHHTLVQAHRVRKALAGQQEAQAPKDHRVQVELVMLQVPRARKDLSEHKDHKDQLVAPAHRDHKDQQGAQAPKDHKEVQVHRARKGR